MFIVNSKNEGWKCPNCGKAHAPWVDTCPEDPIPEVNFDKNYPNAPASPSGTGSPMIWPTDWPVTILADEQVNEQNWRIRAGITDNTLGY